MSIVYIMQESRGKNLIPAESFGDLKVLFDTDRQIMLSPGPAVNELKQKLKDFTDSDYLLLLGDPVLIAAAFAVAIKINYGKAKVLKWDRQEAQYYPITISV